MKKIKIKKMKKKRKLNNYFSYINECLLSSEEKRQNYINNLEELKTKTNEIKSKNLFEE